MDPRANEIAARFKQMAPHLDERSLRLFVAAEANTVGRGGVTLLHSITGLARSTIQRGQEELATKVNKGEDQRAAYLEPSPQELDEMFHKDPKDVKNPIARIRKSGGGRKTKEHHSPDWVRALEKLLDPETRGDPESTLRWTIKSTNTISEALATQGFKISPATIGRKLKQIGFSLQSNKKTLAGSSHPDRNAQFEYINTKSSEFIDQNNPVISVDTKKKEVLGNYKNPGQKWELTGSPTKVNDHDFPSPNLPRALPFGIYDVDKNIGHVVIGTDHDTSEFAANSIYGWWQKYGNSLYKNATKILITADCGGSNGYRINLWKYSVQNIVDKIKIPIHICHFPPGTSKWNKIEHKLFSFISSNWRGEPLIDYETVVKLISSTKTSTGLVVSCVLDYSTYQTGIKLTKEQISSINLIREDFHGEWNYIIVPH